MVAPDGAGYGHSRGLSLREGWHDHAEYIAGLIEAQDVVPAKVAALSGGGIVALDPAVNHPQLVSSLTLFEPPIYGKRHVTPSLIRIVLRAQAERRLRGPRVAFEPVRARPGKGHPARKA